MTCQASSAISFASHPAAGWSRQRPGRFIRRSITLIFAGWVPHGRLPSRSHLGLMTRVGSKLPSHSRFEDPPYRCRPAVACSTPLRFLLRRLLQLQLPFDLQADSPDKAEQFAGHGGDHLLMRLAADGEAHVLA